MELAVLTDRDCTANEDYLEAEPARESTMTTAKNRTVRGMERKIKRGH